MHLETNHFNVSEQNVLSMLNLVLQNPDFLRYLNAENLLKLVQTTLKTETREFGLALLQLTMNLSNSKLHEFISSYCQTTNFEFRFFVEHAKHLKQLKELTLRSEYFEVYESHLCTLIGGVYVPRLGGSTETKLVLTETTSRNLNAIANGLLTTKPLLVRGESGSGKSTLLTEVHSKVSNLELLRIHLGDQTDVKTLVGTYKSGLKPGTFEWAPGALTHAVKNGMWVLVEDIDKAPSDIVAVLVPLIERRELVIPSRNETVKAAPGFMLVATTSSKTCDIIGNRSWHTVDIQQLETSDLVEIITSRKPFVDLREAKMLVSVYLRVLEYQSTNKHTRVCSTTDLMKLVNRLTVEYTLDDKFRECVSVFTSFVNLNKHTLVDLIGDAMNMPPSTVLPLVERYTPELHILSNEVVIGRARFNRKNVTSSLARNLEHELQQSKFTLTKPTLKLLEDIGVAVANMEPVLLVGETGTGKTAVVQHLAKLARRKLVAINVSQQVEVGDLVGGFKPVDAKQLAHHCLEDFYELFDASFNRAKNHKFLEVLETVVEKQQWHNLVKVLRQAIKLFADTNTAKRQKSTSTAKLEWERFANKVNLFESQVDLCTRVAQFSFIEGLLVKAMKHGHWVLLDELNLAPADTIEGIGELVGTRRLTVLENGGEVVNAHPDFRLFANMNPATDVGKRDLPANVRSQFTEIYAASPDQDPEALRLIIQRYLPAGTQPAIINYVAQFYLEARDMGNRNELADGAGQRPHFSIRTLSRALVTASFIAPTYRLMRALYESFSMCFLTLLDDASAVKLEELLNKWILSKIPNQKSQMSQIPSKPTNTNCVRLQHWWMPCASNFQPSTDELLDLNDTSYILTPSVERNMLNLVRASSLKLFPILIQGPTSSGKTSMINFLAKRTGHTVVRINNHEHTDLSEYLGGYESDSNGQLVFREGALVKALKEGHWLILDELNLAPTDVLEALNRLLDDNRELLVPETQELVKPHKDFILFATQNPPGIYAGRKVLSRAFRNRFLELHFGDIPVNELGFIVEKRCGIAPSYANKIVEVFKELSRRKIQRVFEHMATLRDLFRWALRPATSYDELAFNGFMLLGERARTSQEKQQVLNVIETVMKVKVNTDITQLPFVEQIISASPMDIVWTMAMKRVLSLVYMALTHNEPVLLVGETGCGKTTIVQTIALAIKNELVILNAHQNTETGDLVGSQRPVRNQQSNKLFEWVDGPLVTSLKHGNMFLLDEISLADDSVLERLNSVLEPERTLFVPEIGTITANNGFQFLATMNPGGDYGKKELSPALRNRFTEVWVPTVDDDEDLKLIVNHKLKTHSSSATNTIVKFSKFMSTEFNLVVSLRDILSWVEFLNSTDVTSENIVQGACMVFLDGMGIHQQFVNSRSMVKTRCLKYLGKLVGQEFIDSVDNCCVENIGGSVAINGMKLPQLGDHVEESAVFSLQAPTSALNAMRVVRALQVHKPVLLEGSPGAGKTSLVTALAKLCGVRLTRINLSDQTDLSDLFGQDVPLETAGKFGWRSAPFLRAMEQGEWVLLDEMNLAPQPVLEGLNACLDHRGEAYIPELDRVFKKHPKFLVFAAQNPQQQGGGRKGLPKSFVNRFSVVYVDELGLKDLYAIAESTHPKVDRNIRERLCNFIEEVSTYCSTRILSGGPFEFNLRDTLRWLDLIEQTKLSPQNFLNVVVLCRLRTGKDVMAVENMFYKIFPKIEQEVYNMVDVQFDKIEIGKAQMQRTPNTFTHTKLKLTPSQLPLLETALTCIQQAWPLILVGNSGSGKSSIVTLLAQLCGRKLCQFSMTADIDSTDLLGEFDQLEEAGELQRLWAFISETLKHSLLEVNDSVLFDAIKQRNLPVVKNMLKDNQVILNEIQRFEQMDFSKPVFHWVDGMLVKAVENGDWLILDNANLCSSAVLDRLNSLLERGGSLAINECANDDGSPRLVKPHKDFRLFLTVNPKFGELSRAMRNRGVELYVPDNSFKHDLYSEQFSTGKNIAGALDLTYQQPLSNAKLLDTTTKHSFVKAVVVDNRVNLDFVLDTELKEFVKSLNGFSMADLEVLYKRFISFEIKCHLKNVANAEYKNTLFQLSFLKRKQDSIDCDFDVYGMVERLCGELELCSVLKELVFVKDPSRIHVFREYLLENVPNTLKHDVSVFLGKSYDFSAGGSGMETIWQHFGRPFGFANSEEHSRFVRFAETSLKFDLLVQNLSPKFASQISDIRNMLTSANEVDANIEQAITEFQNAAESSTYLPVLSHVFSELWNLVSLVYAARGDTILKDSFRSLSVYAKKSTQQLHDIQSGVYMVPELIVNKPIEVSLVDALRLTSQGQAQLEVNELASQLRQLSWFIADGSDLNSNINLILSKCVAKINEVIPQPIELNSDNSTAANCISLANKLLFLYVCPLVLDPAIAQHVWFERYLNLKAQFQNDLDCWEELKTMFSSTSFKLENFLNNRQLEVEEVPSIWRPEVSTVSVVHRHMCASFSLSANNVDINSKSSDEIDLVLKNCDHLSMQLARATGYRDLTLAVKSCLNLLKLGLTLKQREFGIQSSATSLKFLDPYEASTKFIDSDEYLLSLRSLKCHFEIPSNSKQLFDSVYRQWTLERLKLEEEQNTKQAGFKYQDDLDDEEKVKLEFMQLFPDYDVNDVSVNDDDDFTTKFVEYYLDLFLTGNNSNDILDFVNYAANEIKQVNGTPSNTHLASLYLALRSRTSQFKQAEEIGTMFNFYVDSNADMSSLSIRFAERVQNRIQPLLNKWPEHDSLLGMMQISETVLLLPPSTPVAMHLAKVEQFMHYLADWDKYAAKEFKLSDLVTSCAEIIVKFRRLELRTWPALFDIEKKKSGLQAAKFWYHLYETLIMCVDEDLTQVAKVLIVFVSESTVGQFGSRLQMLEAFEKHLKLLQLNDVHRCVANVRSYFLQFAPIVKEQQDQAEKVLRKQVNEVVKLASFRDTNPAALKQSAQRSHHQLFKYVKKFRTVLESKAETAFKAPITKFVNKESYTLLPSELNGDLIAKQLQPLTSKSEFKARPSHLKDVLKTFKTINEYTNQISDLSVNHFDNFVADILKRDQHLRDETPKVWTKENKKLISGLKLEKQQLLTATQRELKQLGLSSAITKKTLEQLELIRVLTNTPSLQNQLQLSNPHFFALIELLPKLRVQVGEVAGDVDTKVDVPVSDLQRMLGFVENSFYHILRLRKFAGKHLGNNNFNDIYTLINDLVLEPTAIVFENTDALSALKHSTSQVLKVVDAVLMDTTTEHIHQVIAKFNPSQSFKRSARASNFISELQTSLETVCQNLKSVKIGGLVESNLKSVISSLSQTTFVKSELETNFADAHSLVQQTSSLVLVVVQELLKFVQIDDEDEKWYTNLLTTTRKLLLNLRSNEMHAKFALCEKYICSLSRSNTSLASGLASSLLPFMNGYMQIHNAVVSVYSKLMLSTTSGTYKLGTLLFTLSTAGFASPEPLEDDSDDEQQEGEGVGLGDGSGQNNSTKDVDEEDDDVSEAMQTSNPDQQKNDDEMDGEDNSKEVEGDMAGEVEDLPPQSEDDDDEEEDDDEENEMDEEMGSLDDMDSNQVDEKMWQDDRKDETDKEKQSDNKVEGDKDEDLEANEGDSKNTGENDENGNDEDEEIEDQEDTAEQGTDKQELDAGVEDKDALELPSDMEMDGDGDDNEDEDVDEEMEEDTMMEEAEQMEETAEANEEQVVQEQQEGEQEKELNSDDEMQPADEDDDEVDEDSGEMDVEDKSKEHTEADSAPQEDAAQGDADGADIEGVEGLTEDHFDNLEKEKDELTTTDNQTNSRAQGASEDASNEQSNMSSGGQSGANQNEMNDMEDDVEQMNDTSIKNSLKQLGDAMKEFHKRQQEIKQHDENNNNDNETRTSGNEEQPLKGNEELEHVGADDAHDTQALGKAVDNEKQQIDEKMGIDDDMAGSQDVAGDEDVEAETGGGAHGEVGASSESEEDADEEMQSAAFANPHNNNDEDEDVEYTVPQNDPHVSTNGASDLWQLYESKTNDLALVLGEQLRLILEPTIASKLRGDFRTGKRLNMKRIIPYIASDYKKDKIWLRRSKPAKREYQVMLALDDSKSMGEPQVVDLAFQAITLVGKALNSIDAGQIGIAKFGQTTEIVHKLDDVLTPQTGNEIFKKFKFDQQKTNVHHLLETTLDMFKSSNSLNEQWRLEIIVSDGIADDHVGLRRLVRRAYDEKVMLVFVVLDALNTSQSILEMNDVKFELDEYGNQNLKVSRYMDSFAFDYYVIVRDINDLPMVLASVLRQYFQALE